jgi:hypothetical protein
MVVNGVNLAGNDEEDDGLVLFLLVVMFRDETTTRSETQRLNIRSGSQSIRATSFQHRNTVEHHDVQETRSRQYRPTFL